MNKRKLYFFYEWQIQTDDKNEKKTTHKMNVTRDAGEGEKNVYFSTWFFEFGFWEALFDNNIW